MELNAKKSALIAKIAAELGLEVVELKVTEIKAEEMHGLPAIPKGKRIVRNAMNGKTVLEDIDTPWACSVASENYWCS